MTALSFVISGLFLAVMIGDSWYGAVSLPPPLIIMPIVLAVVAFSQWLPVACDLGRQEERGKRSGSVLISRMGRTGYSPVTSTL